MNEFIKTKEYKTQGHLANPKAALNQSKIQLPLPCQDIHFTACG